MGCASSTASEGGSEQGTSLAVPLSEAALGATSSSKLSPYGPLSREQYTSRLVHSSSVRETRVRVLDQEGSPAFTLRWAYASQRGFYPDQPHKARAGRARPVSARARADTSPASPTRRTRTRSARSPASVATRGATSSASSTATAKRARRARSSLLTRCGVVCGPGRLAARRRPPALPRPPAAAWRARVRRVARARRRAPSAR